MTPISGTAKLQTMLNFWWEKKAEVQGYVDTNNTKAFYNAIKTVPPKLAYLPYYQQMETI